MKARIKATGEIVELQGTIDSGTWLTTDYKVFNEYALDFNISNESDVSEQYQHVSIDRLRSILFRMANAGGVIYDHVDTIINRIKSEI